MERLKIVRSSRLVEIVLLGLLLELGGCKVQDEIPALDDRFLTLSSGETMHYLEAGNPAGKPILFVHGYPSSAYLYRNVITRVCPDSASAYRCIAISQIGFGNSSCPEDGSVVSPLYEVNSLELFIQQMGLTDAGLVVHDWGGPIGTLAGLRHADRFTHLVILNTALTFPESGALEKLMDSTDQFFQKPRPVLERLYPGAMGLAMQSMTQRFLSRDVLALYTLPFNKKTDPEAACRIHAGINLFAKGHSDEALFTEIADRALADWYQQPTLFLWSTHDALLGSYSPLGKAAHKGMEALFPQADTVIITDANHFLQEDKPEEIAAAITAFLD